MKVQQCKQYSMLSINIKDVVLIKHKNDIICQCVNEVLAREGAEEGILMLYHVVW